MDKNKYIGKKRNLIESENTNKDINNYNDDSINSTQNSNSEINSNRINIDKMYNDGIILDHHSHWVNKVLILKNQPNHNLMSSSADSLIIIYDNYPNYNPLLKIKLFGDSGVTYLTELKKGSIIACSFGAFKEIILNYNNEKNEFTYETINYYTICTTYISKCIELNNGNLLFISQQNIINILEKIKDNKGSKEKNKINDKFIKISTIYLLKYEICINILQLKDNLYIAGSITDTKYNILLKSSKKVNANYINFYDESFNIVHRINNIYCTKSQENIVKYNNDIVIVGIEMILNEINWNNNKGIAVINYNNFQIISFYQVENQISSILLYNNFLFIGNNKGYIGKYIIKDKEILLEKSKRVHFYNINSICCGNSYEKDLNENLFVIFSGSNDNKIKALTYFKD